MDAISLLSGPKLDCDGFKQLLDSQSLVDCTIACDGGKMSAHKIVLSACSTYLAKILQEHPVEHPIIILPELKLEDVKTLIHYMYTGELLKSETLDSAGLLKTAAILSVNSLNDFLNGSSSNVSSGSATPPPRPTSQQQQQQQQQLAPLIPAQMMQQYSLETSPKLSPLNFRANTSSSSRYSSAGGESFINSSDSLGRNSTSSTSYLLNGRSEFKFRCTICFNHFQTICSFEYHMQRAHNVTSFGCDICHKQFASLRYVLTDHMRRCHSWVTEQQKI